MPAPTPPPAAGAPDGAGWRNARRDAVTPRIRPPQPAEIRHRYDVELGIAALRRLGDGGESGARATPLGDLPVVPGITGCHETLLRASSPTIDALIFDFISLDYQESLMAAAGSAAERTLREAVAANRGSSCWRSTDPSRWRAMYRC
jgi:hypothetical protein